MGPMRVVVEHVTLGLYLGTGAGRHWWTNQVLSSAIIKEAVTFDNKRKAKLFMSHHYPADMHLLDFHEVDSDRPHASIKTLVEAGLGNHCKKLLMFTESIGRA